LLFINTMFDNWNITKLIVNGDHFTWFQRNKLIISKTFLFFSESLQNETKWPQDVIELIHCDDCEYSVLITISTKENMISVLDKCKDVFIEYEEYELAQRVNNILFKFK